MADPDQIDKLLAGVAAPASESPWSDGHYVAELPRLAAILSGCVQNGAWPGSSSGVVGRALDIWVADELRRAGYEADDVWPRREQPRVLPRSVSRAIEMLPATLQSDPIVSRIVDGAGSGRPVVHGEFFTKQVDVLAAHWDRGLELMVSTKSMTGSFGNNLTNRWEEFVGDLRNIRGRFPLAVLGVVFACDARIVDEPGSYGRLVDMLRKLRSDDERDAYDATSLVLAQVSGSNVLLRLDDVPDDLHINLFFENVLNRVFERLPITERLAARRLYEAGVGTDPHPTTPPSG